MSDDRPAEPEIKVSQDGINTNFSLSPRLDQPPSRPMGSTLRGRHHHHNRNHSIDTKDRTSPILGFGPLQSSDRAWIAPDLGGSDQSPFSSDSSQSLDPSRGMNGSHDHPSGLSATRGRATSNTNLAPSSSPNLYPSSRKVSAGSSSNSSSSSSTGSASPDTSFISEGRRPTPRSADRYQLNGASHQLAEASNRCTASPARTFSGAPISPRLQSTMSAHVGLAHARRASADLATAPFRAPSPIFLPSASPPTVPANSDPQHAWDSVWPRSSTPDRADQLRKLGSISPVAGSPGRASPSALSNSMDLSRSPSTSFDSSSPASSSNTVFGRPKARRPHELRGSSSSPVLRTNSSGLRDSHDPSRSPRRSLETARTEPVIKIGFTPPSAPATPGEASRPASAGASLASQSPASKVLSPATEAAPHVDVASVIASHRASGTGSSWFPERAESPSASFSADPRKRTSSVPVPQALPLPTRTPSPKMSPTSPRSPFLELSASSAMASNGSNMGHGESPPKTRSFIAMPPRSGYELSDDPDDVGSEEDGSNSERESVGTNDEDLEGSEYDDEDIADVEGGVNDDDNDEIDDERRNNSEHGAANGVLDSDESPNLGWEAEQLSKGIHDNDSAPERPSLPKRPSLTRSGVVPPPITVVEHMRSPLDPLVQAENSARALAAQKGPTGSAMLSFFRDEPGPRDSQQLGITGESQIGDAVMPSALGLDAGVAQPLDATMEEGGNKGNEEEDDDEEDEQGLDNVPENAEESLNTLERIFLFAKSDMAYHRVLVSQSLPDWIREVELNDAVEYIIPLLNGLATDELDVCAAFAPEIGRVMWFFFRNCPIAELADDSTEMQNTDGDEAERASRPRISLATFTTLLCALLLNQNTVIAGATQQSLVQLFYRLDRRDIEFSKEELAEKSEDEVQSRQQEQDLESYVTHASGRDGQPVPHEDYRFDDHSRLAVKNELLENVALALAQLNHGRTGAEQSEKVEEQSNAPSDQIPDEAMDEDGTDKGAKAFSETGASSEPAASSHDAMDEEHDSREATSWSQGNNMFGQQSDGFASDVQVDEDEESAVGRMASVSLLAALAADELIPPDTLLHRFAPEVLKLIDDGAFYVRKEVASSLGPLSRNMTVEAVEHAVLPALSKAIYERNWHVRQAACFSIPAILGRLEEKLRREQTLVFMRALVNDVSRQIRMAALEIIGEVIYMFHNTEAGVPEELVRFFLGEPFDGPPQQGDASLTFDKTSDPEGTEALFDEDSAIMMDPESDLDMPSPLRDDQDSLLASFGYGGSESSMMDAAPWENNFRVTHFDPERPLIVAYNLPAVVLTLGTDQWSRLRQAHAELTTSDKPKVRKSLAASLHEVAKIIGQEATRDDLLPAATRFVSDEDVEVRTAMFDNVDVFLSCLPQTGAEKMLWQLVSLWSSGSLKDWRLRERLALHIPSMAKQFLLEDEEGNLVSLMQLALADPISAVRDAGIHCVPNLYRTFAEHDQVIADGFLGMVSDLGDSTGYRLRVACLLCIGALVESGIQRSSCELLLLSRLNEMGGDDVVDVRIALSRTLGQMCRKDELYALPQSRSEELNKLIAKLARDKAPEVQLPISGILSEQELKQYAPAVSEEEDGTAPRRLVLGPADGGPHRPEGEGGFTNNFVDAEGDDGDVDVFHMDDDSDQTGESSAADEHGDEEGESGEAQEPSSVPMSQAQSAQHLELSRASIFGAKRQTELELGSDWINANGSAFFDYGDNDEDEDIEDDEGLDDEPHHLLNVDRDSSGSGELIDHEALNEEDEQVNEEEKNGVGLESHEAQRESEQQAWEADTDKSMEECESRSSMDGHGITLSSPQRGMEAGEGGANGEDENLAGSPSRQDASRASGGKGTDPFLAFVAGRRSQDLTKLEMNLSGRMPRTAAAKRSRLSDSTVARSPDATAVGGDDDESETLQSPDGDEAMMGTKNVGKKSGDWSQVGFDHGMTTSTEQTSSGDNGDKEGGEDDFVQV
ncbi:uncharacterized protein MEPE_05319 [Melanopsichium pennsylvanicum]|uniref:Arm repeat-containing protein n=2 Tax=Melanopsichium pennsylvanicum TaxID=63383 RepID=A0AAJ5C772_9BASI|nr:arm repeat-containing protein [Melanopsichium pennsylvanicum 4]SNX86610.1 uncharacterized protein MEPE_05319 [Melanopsichium pennsylvanicum]